MPTYNVKYTYSEKTYDGQTVTLEENTSYHDRESDSPSLPDYKDVFLKQKSIQKIEEKIENKLKKQSIGLPIKYFSFLSNSKEEKMLNDLASQNLKEGKKDFAGYYQIPYQTLIDQELVYMTIFIDDNASVKEQDMKDAAKKLDASDLPNGKYNFFYSNTKDENQDSISYSFKVKDGKVVFYGDENLVLEDDD